MKPLLPDLLIVEGEIIVRDKPILTALLRIRGRIRRVRSTVVVAKESLSATLAGFGQEWGDR